MAGIPAEYPKDRPTRREGTVKRSIFSLALAAAMLVAAPLAHASILNFFVNLSPLNEVPPTNSAGTGTASFVLDTTAQTLEGVFGKKPRNQWPARKILDFNRVRVR